MRLCLAISFLAIGYASGQDIQEAKARIQKLTSEEFWGRGYSRDGMNKAANYLESLFESFGLKPVSGNSFKQQLTYPINTFPGKLDVKLNGRVLKAGEDFLISGESKGVVASGDLTQTDSVHFINKQSKVEIVLQNKLNWSPSTQVMDYTSIQIDKNKFKEAPRSFSLEIQNKFIPKFKANNICGIVKGKIKPDSLIVITAHYDHLGGMGEATFFPGANDNASGVALLLSIAKYYSENPPPYSVAFLCFAGEEAGLIGSKYFIEHSLVDLNKIRFLINLDLMGTGDEGITVVNGSVFKNEFELLTKINDQKNYLTKIKSRGRAANSDHYWFTERGVPSFFIYAMGGIQAYHDIYDRAETLPLTEFEDLFHLIIEFNNSLMK